MGPGAFMSSKVISMPTYEIEHTWEPSQTNKVVAKVGAAVEAAKQGKVPAGFRPVAIYAVPGTTTAHCVWDAPSKDALESLYKSLDIPTRRTIREVQPFFLR